MYLAQISSAEENDSSPQQKIGNSSKYSKIQYNPVLHLEPLLLATHTCISQGKNILFWSLLYKIIEKINGQGDSTLSSFYLLNRKLERLGGPRGAEMIMTLYTNSIKRNVA